MLSMYFHCIIIKNSVHTYVSGIVEHNNFCNKLMLDTDNPSLKISILWILVEKYSLFKPYMVISGVKKHLRLPNQTVSGRITSGSEQVFSTICRTSCRSWLAPSEYHLPRCCRRPGRRVLPGCR